MKRTLRTAAAVVVSLGLMGAVLPAAGLPDFSPMVIGSTGCCKS
nr:hypothetical protein [uncultured Actinotalea sp.]